MGFSKLNFLLLSILFISCSKTLVKSSGSLVLEVEDQSLIQSDNVSGQLYYDYDNNNVLLRYRYEFGTDNFAEQGFNFRLILISDSLNSSHYVSEQVSAKLIYFSEPTNEVFQISDGKAEILRSKINNEIEVNFEGTLFDTSEPHLQKSFKGTFIINNLEEYEASVPIN